MKITLRELKQIIREAVVDWEGTEEEDTSLLSPEEIEAEIDRLYDEHETSTREAADLGEPKFSPGSRKEEIRTQIRNLLGRLDYAKKH